jgi:hypothetical protein
MHAMFALEDDDWYASIQPDFGIDTRPRTCAGS